MSSASPGHVNAPGDPEDGPSATPGSANALAQAAASPMRAPAQKRARAPPTPARSALAMIGTITDTVRAGAVRGLRAITDSMERPREGSSSSSGSSDSGPPSPTTAVRAVSETPHGKRRRTALTDAHTRRTHADWRGSRWDYSSAMRDKNLHRVGDTGPSLFAFPEDRPITGDGPEEAQRAHEAVAEDTTQPRPPSAMSAASAPAALSTPRSRLRRDDDGSAPAHGLSEGGWIVAAAIPDDDPFAISAGGPGEPMDDDAACESDEGGLGEEPFVRAIRAATALLSHDAVNSPDACGALLAFQARLRMHDPYGNFTPAPHAGDSATGELRELRRMVEGVAEAQRACAEALRALAARQPADARPGGATTAPGRARSQGGSPPPTAVEDTARVEGVAAPATDAPRATEQPGSTAKVAGGTATAFTPAQEAPGAPQHAGKGVGRHDPRRAVFRPAKPFGGRIPTPASAEDVRDLNAASYAVRDAVNAALRDAMVAQMDELSEPVQVAGVNWTERGNLCMVVDEGFTAAHLILHADVAAGAAALGPGWRASRDVPIYKAVLRDVPTKRVDGTLFTEEEVLGDLRAHSVVFKSLPLADSAEQASWIATANERARKKRSTLVVNFATAGAAKRFVAMRHCLYALGCACEPGEFQPRERERICRRCWNPLARHRERDFQCRVKCRLCGGGHAEEEHTCHTCDVLARPCAHIPLRCVSCSRMHAADDGACTYRRRLRGTSASAPPMSSKESVGAGGDAARASGKGRKKKRVRILEPHEPFPDDDVLARPELDPAPSPATPAPTQAPADSAAPGVAVTPAKRAAGAARRRKKAGGDNSDPHARTGAAEAPGPSAEPPQPPAPQPAAQPVVVPQDAPGESSPASDFGHRAGDLVITAADDLAVQELVGVATTPAAPADSGPPEAAPTRRTVPPRGAAAEYDRDGRRRRAAHVLADAFGFLRVPEAIAALRTCSDDYASAVSWADEEQNSRRKPGMQGKSAASLQKLVAKMDAAAASYNPPAKATDPAAPPADE